MKKLLVVIAVLTLMVGTAYGADLNSMMTRHYAAQMMGRSVVSDGSVLFRVWYTGTGANPAIGVSSNSTLYLYTDVTTGQWDFNMINTGTSQSTVGGIVDAINAQSSLGWHAEEGPDGYRAFAINNLFLTNSQPASTSPYQIIGRDETMAGKVYLDSSASNYVLCGVNYDSTKVSRLKQFTHRVGGTGAMIMARVRGGADSQIYYREDIAVGAYNTTTYPACSPRTVTFSPNGEKGIAAPMGTNLCVEVYHSGILGDGPGTATAPSSATVSIVYDQW